MKCCATAPRFIPVRTGNGICSYSEPSPRSVYPRAYGERLVSGSAPMFVAGLSPCVRGTGLRQWRELKPERFIPVRTGNGTLPASVV